MTPHLIGPLCEKSVHYVNRNVSFNTTQKPVTRCVDAFPDAYGGQCMHAYSDVKGGLLTHAYVDG